MYLRWNKDVTPNACLSLQIFDYSLITPCILRQTHEFCGKIPLKYNCASKCEVHGVWHLVQQSSRTSTRTVSVCMALTLNVYATLGLMSCPPIGRAAVGLTCLDICWTHFKKKIYNNSPVQFRAPIVIKHLRKKCHIFESHGKASIVNKESFVLL